MKNSKIAHSSRILAYWAVFGLMMVFLVVQVVVQQTVFVVLPDANMANVLAISGIFAILIQMVVFVWMAYWLSGGQMAMLLGDCSFDGYFFLKSMGVLLVFLLLSEQLTTWLGKSPLDDVAILMDGGSLWAWLLLTVVLAPICEELLFRGLILGVLTVVKCQTQLGLGYLIKISVFSSALFAMVHGQYDWFGMGLVFVLSLLFCWVRLHSGSLLMAILVHGANNLFAMMAVFLI